MIVGAACIGADMRALWLLTAALAIAAFAGSAAAAPKPADSTVDLQLVLAVDVSSSMDLTEQLQGLMPLCATGP